MGRRATSVIGIDLGKHVFKGVSLQRKGDNRYVLTGFASREVPENLCTPESIAHELKALVKELGGSRACAIAVSDPESLIRIIEQPETPPELLRMALRLNGLALLNQDCKDYVLDCARVTTDSATPVDAVSGNAKARYLVAGMLRSLVKQVSEACSKVRLQAGILQLAPICSFNAFELAYPEVFANESFLLLDMGHVQSTVLIGRKKELVLVRSIDYGGKSLLQALTADGALDAHAARTLVEEGDPGMKEICRDSLSRLALEVRNSIGFFEGQHEESIQRVYVSGGLARTETILQTLSDELELACELWDPLETCEVALPPAKRQALPNEFVSLNVACGAAFEYLRS